MISLKYKGLGYPGSPVACLESRRVGEVGIQLWNRRRILLVMTSDLSELEGALKDTEWAFQPDMVPLQLLYLVPFFFSYTSSSRECILKADVSCDSVYFKVQS